jgi:hypothetical protein
MEKKNKTVHRKETPVKKRDSNCYQKKVNKVTKWYNKLVENRKKEIEPNTDKNHPDKLLRKRVELKDLQFYLDKIKKAVS